MSNTTEYHCFSKRRTRITVHGIPLYFLYALLTECVRGKAPDAHVFTRADGKPVRDFRKAWYKLCIEA